MVVTRGYRPVNYRNSKPSTVSAAPTPASPVLRLRRIPIGIHLQLQRIGVIDVVTR